MSHEIHFSSYLGSEMLNLMDALYKYAQDRIRSYFSRGWSSWGEDDIDDSPIQVQRIRSLETQRLQALARNPILAHFTLIDSEGKERNYYVTVTAPLSRDVSVPGALLASYRSPVGQFAEYDVGASVFFSVKPIR